jgi:hypothetical protein
MRFLGKKSASKKGTKYSTTNEEFYNRVRKRLRKDKKELSDKYIRDITHYALKDIASWIVDNPEGFQIKDMGVLATSKHLPKEFWDDKEQKIKNIESLDIPYYVKQVFLKRYNIEIGDKLDYAKMRELKVKVPRLNTHTFFYIFRVMWFNHRNCNFAKSQVYEFDFNRNKKQALKYAILDGKDYYEWNFDDFYGHKIKPIEKGTRKYWQTNIKKEVEND